MAHARSLWSNYFKSITLFGGIASDSVRDPAVECACHDVVPLKSASLGDGDLNHLDIGFSRLRKTVPEHRTVFLNFGMSIF